MKSILSEKGQITLPIEFRNRMGLRPGQENDFVVESGVLIGRKTSHHEGLQEVVGILKSKIKNVDDYLNETRGNAPKSKL